MGMHGHVIGMECDYKTVLTMTVEVRLRPWPIRPQSPAVSVSEWSHLPVLARQMWICRAHLTSGLSEVSPSHHYLKAEDCLGFGWYSASEKDGLVGFGRYLRR